jgi:uncharacterized membrane protein HdeD (DUF308 family)
VSQQTIDQDALSAHYSKPVAPTEPASIAMGVITLVLGVAAAVARPISGPLFTVVLGIAFLVFAGAHVVYGLHAHDWRNLISILLNRHWSGRSRPFLRGLGPLAAGLLIVTLAIFGALRWPMSGNRALGLWVGLALICGGISPPPGSAGLLATRTRRRRQDKMTG